jgi:hypothetical protein
LRPIPFQTILVSHPQAQAYSSGVGIQPIFE